MKQAVDIGKVHAMVWAFRASYGGAWPTPDRMDSLRFALCESAEAMDAWLRGQPRFNRNRAKELSVLDELADTAIMLLTALGEARVQGTVLSVGTNLDTICGEVAFILRCMYKGFAWGLIEAKIRETVANIALYPGMDLGARIAQRLERIRLRVMAETVVSPQDVMGGYADGLGG